MLLSFPEPPYVADANSPRLSELERKSKGKGKGKSKSKRQHTGRRRYAGPAAIRDESASNSIIASPDNQPVAAGVAQASGSSSPVASDSEARLLHFWSPRWLLLKAK
ncbi:hypothetical protein CMUS01_04799 [Colletotrichum musicola]|uniref:Uncharacterized protein n=1 Tax=Colletotrichum musicola TaxID=2175873 RepID=A0A8H6KVI0_9PEZI|nr:hypothetical protein CMUS01_04799 [Colletotrichum musicola]